MKRRHGEMMKIGLVGAVLLLVVLSVACAAPGDVAEALPAADLYAPEETEEPAPASPSGWVAHAWVEPDVDGDAVTIPLDVVLNAGHVHFSLPVEDETLDYLGYMLDGSFYVRATVCPSCGSQGLSYGGNALVCHSCSTVFDLVTGEADDEESVDFPQGLLPYDVADALIRMSFAELVQSYERTAAGEDTLFEVVVETPPDDEEEDTSWPRCCGR
jgi:hypothetical protein